MVVSTPGPQSPMPHAGAPGDPTPPRQRLAGRYDVFFSISQTPVDGVTPSEKQMFDNFFDEVRAADELGYGVAWVAESHLSSEVQKGHSQPVVPHWQGEVGLNTDITQLAHRVFAHTSGIEVGSAVMNILCNGGPIAAAERLACFAALHGRANHESRRLHVGFSAGRFDFMNRAAGIVPRDDFERALGPVLKGKIFWEACEIFLRLLRGDTLTSDDIPSQSVGRDDFRSDAHWQQARAAWGAVHDREPGERLTLNKRWAFEALKIIPQDFRRSLIVPVIGSHEPALQSHVNRLSPVQVFNLSITAPAIIEETHDRMRRDFHPSGGPWRRDYMPRTVLVFVNADPGVTAAVQSDRAKAQAARALAAYWTALEGTLDPKKVSEATQNAVIGNVDEVAQAIAERFHPEDRLMLWFDFFDHDAARVSNNLRVFAEQVVPRVEARRR